MLLLENILLPSSFGPRKDISVCPTSIPGRYSLNLCDLPLVNPSLEPLVDIQPPLPLPDHHQHHIRIRIRSDLGGRST